MAAGWLVVSKIKFMLRTCILGWASGFHYIPALLALAIFWKKNFLLLYIFKITPISIQLSVIRYIPNIL